MKTETQDLAVLNRENYENVLNMLKSNDAGSVQVAYSALENMDFNESEIYIFCILKQANEEVSNLDRTIAEKAPELYKKLQEYSETTDTNVLTFSFKNIYMRARDRNKNEEVEFLLDLFKNELVTLLQDYGLTFLEYLDIQIKPKEKL